MKRVLGIMTVAMIIACQAIHGQGALTFRFANPRIFHNAGFDQLEFDIQVKASVAGTFLWSGQANLAFDNSTLTQVAGQWIMVRGPLLSGTNSADNYKYTLIRTITGTEPQKVLNIGWTGDVNVAPNTPNPVDFNEVPVTFTTLVTLKARISNTGGTAGIGFVKTSMNGQQFFCSALYPYYAAYSSPNVYDAKDLADLYLGRIYSGAWGWSQANNPVNGQWVEWSAAVNTSVWDSVAGPALLNAAGAKTGALRIHPASRLKLQSASTLTCTGPIEVKSHAGLWLSSGATESASLLDNGTIICTAGGTILCEKYLIPGQWNGYCLPVTTTTTAPYSGIQMKYWSEPSQSYRYVVDPPPPDSILTGVPFRGYLTKAPPESGITRLAPVGTLVTGAVNSVPLTRSLPASNIPYNGFNLIGNPYMSAVDLGSGTINWSTNEPKAWFPNPSTGGNYEVYLPAGGGTHSQYAPAQQAFFIRHSEDNTNPASLSFDNGMRTHTTSDVYNPGTLSDLLYLKVQNQSGNATDRMSVCFRQEAGQGYDALYDADKLWGDGSAPQLYSTIPGRSLTIQSLPWSGPAQVIPVGFTCSSSGNYSIIAENLDSFSPASQILLEDLKLNVTQSLRTNPQYSFTHTAGDNPDRFLLHFTNPSYPSAQASNLVLSNILTTQFTLNWTDGNGIKRIVFIRQDTTGTPSPVAGINYNAAAAFGSGTQIGTTGWYCIFNGTTHNSGITVTNLQEGSNYRIMVCEYNEIAGVQYYNTIVAQNNPVTQRTCTVINPQITGNSTACLATTGNVYTTEANMNNYVWNVTGGTITGGVGTRSVTVTWNTPGSGQVSVSYKNQYGCASNVAVKPVQVLQQPASAGTIVGPASVCVGAAGVSYCVPVIANATAYNWTASAGATITSGATSNCISVTFPGSPATSSISVFGTNQCFNGASAGLTVSVNPLLTGQLALGNMNVLSGRDLCFDGENITTAGSGTNFIVQSGGAVDLIGSQYVKLLYGTWAKQGSRLNAFATSYCIPCAGNKSAISLEFAGDQTEEAAPERDWGTAFFRIFPNPTRGALTLDIRMEKGQACHATVRIHSMLGEEIFIRELQGQCTTSLSLEDQPAGIYLITVVSGERLGAVKIIRY